MDRWPTCRGALGSPDPGGSLQVRASASGPLGPVIDLRHGGLGATSWRADGDRFASSGQDGTVRVWDPRSGELLAERQLADEAVTGVDYSRDGSRLIVAEASGTVYAIDGETLQPAGPRVDTGHPLAWVFRGTDDNTAIVIPNDPLSESVLLVDVANGRILHDLDPGFAPWWAGASPDGSRIVVTGAGGQVRVFDNDARGWLGPPILAHAGLARSVAWSADGATLLTGGVDGRLGLWNGATGALIGSVVPGAPDAVLSAAFVGDTSIVRAAASDGSVYTWNTDPDSWVEFACAVAGRNLSMEEWQDAFADRPYQETCRVPES